MKASLSLYNESVVILTLKKEMHYMNEFVACTVFSLTCLFVPIVVAGVVYMIVDICNKLQPKVTKLVDSNYR